MFHSSEGVGKEKKEKYCKTAVKVGKIDSQVMSQESDGYHQACVMMRNSINKLGG